MDNEFIQGDEWDAYVALDTFSAGGWGGASPPGGPGPDVRDPEDHGPPASEPPQWFEQLTARERVVARLIAQGLTNKQIAARLVVAEGTVERHVANILGKLAMRSRVEVAMWAVAQRWEDERPPTKG